ncbi:MAG: hypothetical protein FWG51_06100 [Firmicutes bacterium]|nr:hypothetical protein [Bacillota bacterium]
MTIAGEDLNLIAVLISNEIAKNKTSDEISLIGDLATLIGAALAVLAQKKSEQENTKNNDKNSGSFKNSLL